MTKASAASPNLREKSQILSGSEIERTLVRLAHEIVEKSNGATNLGLVGIMRRGVPLAQRLAKILGRIEKTVVPVGTLDIALYRDDLSDRRPSSRGKEEHDGVQHSRQGHRAGGRRTLHRAHRARRAGRFVRPWAACRRIQLCVLIDRGHRELPIEARFVGRRIQTSQNEIIEVKLQETDGTDKVLLMKRVAEGR